MPHPTASSPQTQGSTSSVFPGEASTSPPAGTSDGQPKPSRGAAEWILAISTIVILSSEIITTAASAVWATASLFHMGLAAMLALAALISVPGIWLCTKVVQLAFAREGGMSSAE